MKTKISDLRQKSAPELMTELTALLREQFKLKLQKASGSLTKNHLLKNVRRDIARIHGIVSELQRETV